MKDWLTVGEFSKQSGISPKALRLYDKLGLLIPAQRGGNTYRYYSSFQLKLAQEILHLKSMGFHLKEIQRLFSSHLQRDQHSYLNLLREKILITEEQILNLKERQNLLQMTLSQTKQKKQERTSSMIKNQNCILVTGTHLIKETAQHLQKILSKEQNLLPPIYEDFNSTHDSKIESPRIYALPEKSLNKQNICSIQPDILIINNTLKKTTLEQQVYLDLAAHSPAQTIVFNADDRLSIRLATQPMLRKQSRFFYYSKNGSLKKQIKNIGGVVSDGDQIHFYGLNSNKKPMKIPLSSPLPMDKELSLISALTGSLDLGLSKHKIESLIHLI